MCEVCDIQDEIEKLSSELTLRFMQYQAEIGASRSAEAGQCVNRINEITAGIIQLLDKRQAVMDNTDTIIH